MWPKLATKIATKCLIALSTRYTRASSSLGPDRRARPLRAAPQANLSPRERWECWARQVSLSILCPPLSAHRVLPYQHIVSSLVNTLSFPLSAHQCPSMSAHRLFPCQHAYRILPCQHIVFILVST